MGSVPSLHVAVKSKTTLLCISLLRLASGIRAEHNTALYIAARIGNIVAADILLDDKANNAAPHSHKETPLTLLCGMSSYI